MNFYRCAVCAQVGAGDRPPLRHPQCRARWRRLTAAEVQAEREKAHLQEAERWFKNSAYYSDVFHMKYETQRLGFVYLLRWAMLCDGVTISDAKDFCTPTNGVPA